MALTVQERDALIADITAGWFPDIAADEVRRVCDWALVMHTLDPDDALIRKWRALSPRVQGPKAAQAISRQHTGALV